MDENELEVLRKMLGKDFSEEELSQVLKEDPDLTKSFPALEKLFLRIKSQQPVLSPQFTSQVLRTIRKEKFWSKVRELILTWKNLAVATACTATFVFGWYVGTQNNNSPFPSVAIQEISAPGEEKVFKVRFSFREPTARMVAVAGDFNQWVPTALMPSQEEAGVFSIEITIKEGIYSYSYVIDGEHWVEDRSAKQVIGDQLGGKNSIIQL
jgi:hypothetical protein